MSLKSAGTILFAIQAISLTLAVSANQLAAGENDSTRTSGDHADKPLLSNQTKPPPSSGDLNKSIGLEARVSDRTFVKDIVDRLHALDADIGKLLYNSTSMYAPNDQSVAQDGGGEKFTEVLNDLDALQDEVRCDL